MMYVINLDFIYHKTSHITTVLPNAPSTACHHAREQTTASTATTHRATAPSHAKTNARK